MTIKGKAYIAGVFEHPTRKADDTSLAQLHAEVAKGALQDAGLTKDDVDGYFCAGDAPGLGPLSMADYMGLKVRHIDTTETGGSSYVVHVGHAAEAITDGGGALVVVAPEVAKRLNRPRVRVLGAGEAPKHQMGGKIDLTYTGAARSGPAAFAEAGVKPSDVKYVSIYDSFTITVLVTL